MDTIKYAKSIEDKILKNFYKQSADKIIQHLSSVREDREKNSRRWVWELIQNAKDVPNTFGRVNIWLELNDTELIFSHNGNPFSEDNLISLIQQVSSKDSENVDENVTGKFGTGFISTHLLSDIIFLSGILNRDNGLFQKFKIEIDRRAEKSEDLVPLIEKTIEKIRNLDNDSDFELIDNYSSTRHETILDTKFVYPLYSQSSKTAALLGIEDLVNTLPLTLIFIEKINSIKIINKVTSLEEDYSCTLEKSDGDNFFYKVIKKSSGEKIDEFFFVKRKYENVEIVVKVSDFNKICILPFEKNTPFLFRDFPLIGTEKFFFPCILNGINFFTSVDRDAILINGTESKQLHNKSLLEAARHAALDLTDFLLEKEATNLFVLAKTRIPLLPSSNEETGLWLNQYQTEWRKQLVDKKLVETIEGTIKINELKLPRSKYSKSIAANQSVHNFVSDLFGKAIVPRIDLQEKWIEIFEPEEEYSTWSIKAIYDEEEILNTINNNSSLDLLIFYNTDISNKELKCSWINNFIAHLAEYKQLEQLDVYSIIPNEYGAFNKISSLWWEDVNDPIPDAFLDILKMLDKDWRAEMINRYISFEGLPKSQKALSDVSRAINEVLSFEKSEKGVKVYDFLDHPKSKEVLIEILCLISENTDEDSFRYKLFIKGKELLKFQQSFKNVNNLKSFSFTQATELFIKIINKSIERCGTVKGLAQTLEKNEEDTFIWLGEYLKQLEDSKEYNTLIKFGNIIPNLDGLMCAYEDLYNFGVESQKLDIDLLLILKSFNKSLDWTPLLLSEKIPIKLKQSKTFEELASEIKTIINDIYKNDELQNYRDQILSLIDWYNNPQKSQLKTKYLQELENKLDEIYSILTIKNSRYKKEILDLMKKQENLPVLIALSESGVPLDKMQTLLNSIKESGELDKVIEYAEELQEEKRDFQFKLTIGNDVEALFQEVLNSEKLDGVVQYRGSGSHDFVITNPNNGKQFFIELKSYKNADNHTPIKMAISQARLAVNESERFALCILERPEKTIVDINNYIKTNLKYLGGLKSDFEPVINKATDLDRIIKDCSSISLDLKDPTYGVKVSHQYIDVRKENFTMLISKIKSCII